MFYSFSEDLRYAYSVGELKVWENKLLTQRELERLYSSLNLEEVSTILNEAGYRIPEKIEEVFLKTDDFLSLNLELLYKAIKNLSYHPQITDLFFIRYDFKNFGVLLKNKFAEENFKDRGISEREALVKLGLYGLRNLVDSFEKRNYEIYPQKVSEIFLEVEKEANRMSLQTIDQVLDREYFNLALDLSTSNSFCQYIFKIFADSINLKNSLRFKLIKKDISSFGQFFIDGGMIPKADFVDFFNGVLNLDRLLSRYSYQKIFPSQGENSNLDLIEKKSDDFLMDVLKETKFSFIGLESVIAYLLVKELEIKNLRLILQGKSAGLTEQELMPYLRETYV